MAQIKITYIGGGSTRAAGTVACFIERGAELAGSELCLVDLNADRLELVRQIAGRLAEAKGVDLNITATTDRREGLAGADAVLTSFRPGAFEARVLDEKIPRKFGVIGQETQGPGGLFMSFRSIHVMQGILDDIAAVCPRARIFNYTNPVNIVAQAISENSDVPIVSLCEGPWLFPARLAGALGLDPDLLDVTSVGINHASWSVEHRYGGQDAVEVFRAALHERSPDEIPLEMFRLARILDTMGSFPSGYFQYYFFEREIARELGEKATTRAEDILALVPSYWAHYEEQAAAAEPVLDPSLSRGGLHELELAVDAIDAVFNDRGTVLPVNVPNDGGCLPGFPEQLVVEILGRCSATGVTPLPAPKPLPPHLAGIVETLAEYQLAAAAAAWSGTRKDGLRALAMHPFVRSLDVAERLYDEMAAAHRQFLPERLLH